jgi:diketogulonate reductase-like aldo/keto reductase
MDGRQIRTKMMRSLFSLCIFLAFSLVTGSTSLFDGYKKKSGLIADIPAAELANEVEFPLIGLGVGNLQSNRIENMIYEGLKGENRIRLFDTCQSSGNEHEIIQGIKTGVKRFKETENIDDRVQVHIVTRIWHTYLGYERTKIAVKRTLHTFGSLLKEKHIDLRVHVLIVPRCTDGIDGVDCEHDESQLPDKIKRAGPAPHLDKENAWKESWRALQDLYNSPDYPLLASIGISNFSAEEVEHLIRISDVKPHLIQMNVSSLLHDTKLVDLCKRNNIHIQVYKVMAGIVTKALEMPRAHQSLLMIGDALSSDKVLVEPSQIALKWLIQNGISTIPRTHDLDHLTQNSAGAIVKLPDLSKQNNEVLAIAIRAIHDGVDLEEDPRVKVTFYASKKDIFLYLYEEDVKDQQQISYIGKGDSFEILSHPKRMYRTYDAYNPEIHQDYTIAGGSGDHLHIHVDNLP